MLFTSVKSDILWGPKASLFGLDLQARLPPKASQVHLINLVYLGTHFRERRHALWLNFERVASLYMQHPSHNNRIALPPPRPQNTGKKDYGHQRFLQHALRERFLVSQNVGRRHVCSWGCCWRRNRETARDGWPWRCGEGVCQRVSSEASSYVKSGTGVRNSTQICNGRR